MAERPPAGYTRAARVLRWLSPLVPKHRRAQWRAEWQAELWQQLQGAPGRSVALFGAVPHALSLRFAEWHFHMIPQDVRYAWRGLRRRPAFTLPVILLLGAGIAVTTTMFTVVNSVLIEPVPYPSPEQLVAIYGKSPSQPRALVSAPDLLDYRVGSHTMTAIAGLAPGPSAVLTGAPGAASISTTEITANYFATLGVPLFLGRSFRLEEEGDRSVVILSYHLWHTRYADDATVIGRHLTIDGAPVQVIGVLPPVIDRMSRADLYRPFDFHSSHSSTREYHNDIYAIGRLRPGITVAKATTELNVVAARLAATYPDDRGFGITLKGYGAELTAYAVPRLLLLAAATTLLLLIVCGSVASMLLARATARSRELLVRTAIGASRADLIRFVLLESAILAAFGATIGLLATGTFVHLVTTLRPSMLPRAREVEVNPRVLIFVAAIAVLTALLCGAAPAWRTARRVMTPAALTESRSDQRRRDIIVTLQFAFTLVLLISGALLIRSLARLEQVNPGFNPTDVITAQVAPPTASYDLASRTLFMDRLLERIRATPGVSAAAVASKLVMASTGGNAPVWSAARPPANADEKWAGRAEINVVSDDYYRTMQIPVIDGAAPRGPSEGVVISASLAERLYPLGSAIGQQVNWDFGRPSTATVLAVVGDVRTTALEVGSAQTLYFTADRMAAFLDQMTIVTRSTGDPARLEQPLRGVIASLDPDLPMTHVQLLRDVVGNTTVEKRWVTALLAGFSLLALLLAMAGMFGALAYSVTLRTREFGIRAALGAGPPDIAKLVLRRGIIVVGIGVCIGLAVALAATGLVRSWLFEVRPADPVSFIGATLLLCVAGAAACAVPARRAMNTAPHIALRTEQ